MAKKVAGLNLNQVGLGPISTAVRSKVTPHQWRQLVNAAHKKGFAIESFLDTNTPGPLKERTPAFLRKQAYSTVATAYKPAQQELDQRAQRVKALDDKRASDNQYYLNWLNSQHAALTSQAEASDQALRDAATTIQQQTGAAYDQAGAAAKQQLSQLPGVISDPGQANAFGAVGAHKATGVGQVGATAQQALQGIDTGQQTRELASANNFATIGALEGKRMADTWAAQQGIEDDRFKLSTQQAADVEKAIEDSQSNEVTKAQSNRDYNALIQKLDIQQQGVLSQIQSRKDAAANARAQTRLGRDKLNETAQYHKQLVQATKDAQNVKDASSAADFEAKWGVSRHTFLGWSDAERQSYLQRARERGVITGGKGSGSKGSTKATQGNYNKAYAKVFSGSYQVTKPDPKDSTKTVKVTQRFDPTYVQKHYDEIVSLLVSSGFDQAVAEAAVNQYLNSGGSAHPGSLRNVQQRIKSTKGPGGAH